MNYDNTYSGKYYQLADGAIYHKNVYGKYAAAYAVTGKIVQVQLTGYYLFNNGNKLYQTTTGGFVDLAEGWKYVMYAPLRYYTAKDVQYYVDKIVKANKQILQNNLFCATFASKLSDDEQFTLYQLQLNLQTRNNQLLEDGFCTDIRVSSPPGYNLLSNNLSSFMSAYANGASINGLPNGTIGAVITVTTTTIVIAAIAVASLATAAYFAYKYLASEAEQDIKYSEELTKILMERLTPEEYEMLKRETSGIVTKQKIAAQFGGATKVLKWGLVAAAGVIVYQAVKQNVGGNNKKKVQKNGKA